MNVFLYIVCDIGLLIIMLLFGEVGWNLKGNIKNEVMLIYNLILWYVLVVFDLYCFLLKFF